MIFTHTFTYIIHIYILRTHDYILSTFTDIKTILVFESLSTAYSLQCKDRGEKTMGGGRDTFLLKLCAVS